MRTIYEVEFWLLALPWVLLIMWLYLGFRDKYRIASLVSKLEAFKDAYHIRKKQLEGAEAEARESSAAHNACAEKLKAAEAEIIRLTPKHDKLGRFTTKEPQ